MVLKVFEPFKFDCIKMFYRTCCEAFQGLQHKVGPCRSFVLKYIEDIYIFEVKPKYISSNVLKISVKLLIFSTHVMAYFVYLPTKK